MGIICHLHNFLLVFFLKKNYQSSRFICKTGYLLQLMIAMHFVKALQNVVFLTALHFYSIFKFNYNFCEYLIITQFGTFRSRDFKKCRGRMKMFQRTS